MPPESTRWLLICGAAAGQVVDRERFAAHTRGPDDAVREAFVARLRPGGFRAFYLNPSR